MTHQIITCPNCHGSGCSTCHNTGKVRVSQEQIQKLKQIASQLQTAPLVSAQPSHSSPLSQTNPSQLRRNTNLAGIIAFSFLSILAGAASASWYFLKTLKPFFGFLISLLILIGTRFAWFQPFFQPQEPDDFLKAIKK